MLHSGPLSQSLICLNLEHRSVPRDRLGGRSLNPIKIFLTNEATLNKCLTVCLSLSLSFPQLFTGVFNNRIGGYRTGQNLSQRGVS